MVSKVDGSSEFALLVEFNLRHPAQQIIGLQKWEPRGLAWPAPGDVLIVTAVSAGGLRQLWMVRHDTGEATRLTNDLSDYGHVSITGDGKSILTVQSQSTLTMWAATDNYNLRFNPVSANPLSPLQSSVAWAPEGKIIYTDSADGFRNIWRMDASGANPQRVTSSPIDKDDADVTSDGRYIVYHQQGAYMACTQRRNGTEATEIRAAQCTSHLKP